MPKEQLEQSLQQKLQQRINPQHVALGRVLEMTAPEFEEEVRRELDENPALEALEPQYATPSGGDDGFDESAEQLQRADYADEDDIPAARWASNRSADDPRYDAAALAADDEEDLPDTLMRRLRSESELTDRQLLIAEYIIGNLDANGYLTRPLSAIAGDMAVAEGINVSDDQMRLVFAAVRALDPAGIGAVDLRDCLLLQLDRREKDVTVLTASEILRNYFDLFSKRHYERLLSELDISREDLGRALELIKTLNPKPGASLGGGRGSDRTRHITPDFVLDYDEDSGRFVLSLGGNIPELAIEESFRPDPDARRAEAESSGKAGSRRKEAFEYIRLRRESAADFIALASMRASTLMSIGRAIAGIQRRFFVSGDMADLRPMILKDVAERAGVDISAVSRAVSGKYILTPHGMYAMKSLFNERPNSDSEASTPAILKALGEIIDGEDKADPLSDRELTARLAARGFDIARRTVAKYRERLGQPVARLRKQL